MSFPDLTDEKFLLIQQRLEIAELVGFETRNKYEVKNGKEEVIAYAAEQGKGFLNLMLRGFFGHWRKFEIHFFTPRRQLMMIVKHPFRFFFQRLEVIDSDGECIGYIQQRFSILSKKFDILNVREKPAMSVRTRWQILFPVWTFPFYRNGIKMAVIKKKWSGIFTEALTDRDNFLIEYISPTLSQKEKQIILAAGLFIDLLYFENKAND